MKHLSLVLISVCVVGHTLGFYLQDQGLSAVSSCGCGKIQEYDHTVDSAEEQSPDDTKYKFDFEVEQPKASALQAEPKSYGYQVGTPVSESKQDDTKYKFNFEVEEPKSSDSETESKSYKYQIRTPQSETKPDDTKYKFDYTLQVPAEEKLVETPQRTLYTKVDKVSHDKSECSCKQGDPCTCGYSGVQYVQPWTDQNAYSSRYVLPVQYDNEDEYVVYPTSEEDHAQYLHRIARQAGDQTPLANLFSGDAIKQAAENIRQGFAQLATDMNAGGERLGSTLGSALNTSPERSDQLTSVKEKFVSFAADFFEKFRQGFAVQPVARKRRDVSDAQQDFDKRMPMLRVKEYEPSLDNSKYSKHMSNSRVELKAPENQAMNLKEMEKATLCHSCGSKLCDSVCRQCGKYQPQYVEYIEGKPVSYFPGAIQAKIDDKPSEAAKPRYIFDRYGHKYLENNGNLRLLAPQFHQEAIVGDQPDFAGLANILNENREIIHQLNLNPGRLLPEPLQLASETIDLIRDMARQNNNEYRQSQKRSTSAVEKLTLKYKPIDQLAEKKLPRSMYQVAPMRYDGKDGKLVVKVYSAKDDKHNSEAKKFDETGVKTIVNGDDMPDKWQMNVKKYTKNNKEYELLTFDDYTSNDDEDIRRIIEHLHKNDANNHSDNTKSH